MRVNVKTRNMLSVTTSKESCLIEVMFTNIEFSSFFIQLTKGSNTKKYISKHLFFFIHIVLVDICFNYGLICYLYVHKMLTVMLLSYSRKHYPDTVLQNQ